MNEALEQLALEIDLTGSTKQQLRLSFAYACATRVAHLLEDSRVIDCLKVLDQYLQAQIDHATLERSQREVVCLANQHPGSKSIDGCGHAAVSASYAVANALSGNALQAANYSAYAMVYASGGYAAVLNREAFMSEFEWQVQTLKGIAYNAG